MSERRERAEAGRGRRTCSCALWASLAMLLLGGCNTLDFDSYMDPSVVGRWERTPTVAPVIERIHVIEETAGGGFVEYSEIEAADLIPVIEDYRIGNGDQVEVRIRSFFGVESIEEPLIRRVKGRGQIELPQLGTVQIAGLTEVEAAQRIKRALADARILEEAQSEVAVAVVSPREATFSVLGAINGSGAFIVPEPDYRLLEAITAAGGINEAAPFVYVIRQIPLTDEVERGLGAEPTPPTPDDVTPPDADPEPSSPDSIIDLIDELSGPDADETPTPGAVGSRPMQPENPAPAAPPIPLIDEADDGASGGSNAADPRDAEAGWEWVDGRWVRRASEMGGAAGNEGATDPGEEGDVRPEDLVTQRVIRVPVKPLLAGAADVNIVIRPGDVVRIPQPSSGLVYMTGQVTRPGPYTIPATGTFTLTRAVAAAGGLSTLAIPERVDVIRMIGQDRQAWVRVNLRAIESGAFPDIVLCDSDRINVGTNFWAYPLAVVRNGFRASYGFGFLLDRNFGNDVFGAPPSNVNR